MSGCWMSWIFVSLLSVAVRTTNLRERILLDQDVQAGWRIWKVFIAVGLAFDVLIGAAFAAATLQATPPVGADLMLGLGLLIFPTLSLCATLFLLLSRPVEPDPVFLDPPRADPSKMPSFPEDSINSRELLLMAAGVLVAQPLFGKVSVWLQALIGTALVSMVGFETISTARVFMAYVFTFSQRAAFIARVKQASNRIAKRTGRSAPPIDITIDVLSGPYGAFSRPRGITITALSVRDFDDELLDTLLAEELVHHGHSQFMPRRNMLLVLLVFVGLLCPLVVAVVIGSPLTGWYLAGLLLVVALLVMSQVAYNNRVLRFRAHYEEEADDYAASIMGKEAVVRLLAVLNSQPRTDARMVEQRIRRLAGGSA